MKYIKSSSHNIEFTSFNGYNLKHKLNSRKNKHMPKRIKKIIFALYSMVLWTTILVIYIFFKDPVILIYVLGAIMITLSLLILFLKDKELQVPCIHITMLIHTALFIYASVPLILGWNAYDMKASVVILIIFGISLLLGIFYYLHDFFARRKRLNFK